MLYRFVDVVAEVRAKREVLSTHKGPNFLHDKNDVVHTYGPELWWVTIGNFAFCLGPEKPPFQVGDRVKLTIERSGP